jgi:hypothetical protein
MKELLYFSFSNLLIRVEYEKEMNTFKYSSHREITFGERVVVEQYLLSNTALKTDYYNRFPATFSYLGKDIKLQKDYNLFHLKNVVKTISGKDKEIKEQVDNLIARSMSNYYFEQIGSEIVTLRKVIEQELAEQEINEIKLKMNELIKAYNTYSNKKISMNDVIPIDLKSRLQFI